MLIQFLMLMLFVTDIGGADTRPKSSVYACRKQCACLHGGQAQSGMNPVVTSQSEFTFISRAHHPDKSHKAELANQYNFIGPESETKKNKKSKHEKKKQPACKCAYV